MAEKQILSLKPAPRLEQVGDEHSKRVQDRKQRWSRFLRQAVKVDSTIQGMIHHEDAETLFSGVQGQGCA